MPNTFEMSLDLVCVLTLLGLAAAIAVAYGARVRLKGQAHFERVDRQGGSALLSKSIMELGYWFFQPVARVLIFCRVSANQISWGSFFFGLVSGLCLAMGHLGFGALFSAVSSVLDSLDGMVARMTRQSSDAGEVLDAAVDRYVEFFFLSGLIIYYREVPALLVLALIALMGSFMVSYSTAKAEALQICPPRGAMRRPERAFYLTLGAALSPVVITFFERGQSYPVPIAYPMIFALILVAVMANVSAVHRLWAIAQEIRLREKIQATPSEKIALKNSVSSANSRM